MTRTTHTDGGSGARDPSNAARVVACRDCDAMQAVFAGRRQSSPVCFRCGAALTHAEPRASGRGGDRARALALTLAAVPLFIAAQVFPLVRMEGHGERVAVTVLGSVKALHDQRLPALAMLVLLTTVVFPAARLAATTWLASWRHLGAVPPAAMTIVRALNLLRPWNQLEILLLGMVVAFGKLASIFHVTPGVGLPALVAVLLLDVIVRSSVDHRDFPTPVAAAPATASPPVRHAAVAS